MLQSARIFTCYGDHTVGRCVGMVSKVTNMIAVANENASRLQHKASAQAEYAIKSILHSPGKLEFLLLGLVMCTIAEATLHGKKVFHATYSAFDKLSSFLYYVLQKPNAQP